MDLYSGDEEVVSLFYDKCTNVFLDENGDVIWSILDWVTTNDLYLFQLYKENMSFRHRFMPNLVCELFYPEDPLWD